MNREQKFLHDFKEWIITQVSVNQAAIAECQHIADQYQDEYAREAFFRYQAKQDIYEFLQKKFEHYDKGYSFHDFPDEM